MKLQISDNGRFLTFADGKPFFYLADTAWELFHRLTREEADTVISPCAATIRRSRSKIIGATWIG